VAGVFEDGVGRRFLNCKASLPESLYDPELGTLQGTSQVGVARKSALPTSQGPKLGLPTSSINSVAPAQACRGAARDSSGLLTHRLRLKRRALRPGNGTGIWRGHFSPMTTGLITHWVLLDLMRSLSEKMTWFGFQMKREELKTENEIVKEGSLMET